MRPLINQILNSIQKSHLKLQATLAELRQNNHDQSSYPGHTKISPQVVRRLWQSCVQIQATQYLRYIAHPPLIEEIQTKLNSTLQKAFKCYGQPTNLQADLGVPPLIYTRHKDLIRLHFRLTVSHADSLAASLYKYRLSQTSLSIPQASHTIEHEILQSIRIVFPSWTSPDPLPQPSYLAMVQAKNKEKSFTHTLKPLISDIWRSTLLLDHHYPSNSRPSAYINIAGHDLHRPDLFTPAPYLLLPSKISTTALLRVRTQHEPAIPSHKHLHRNNNANTPHKKVYIPYPQRNCHLCNPPSTSTVDVIASEEHYIFLCPHTTSKLLPPLETALARHLRLLRRPPFPSLLPHEQLSLALGGSLPRRWATNKLTRDSWLTMSTPHCALLAINLTHALQNAPPLCYHLS